MFSHKFLLFLFTIIIGYISQVQATGICLGCGCISDYKSCKAKYGKDEPIDPEHYNYLTCREIRNQCLSGSSLSSASDESIEDAVLSGLNTPAEEWYGNKGSSNSKTATPDSGYSFLGWFGSCSGNSFNVTVASSKVADCTFNQLPIPPATITGIVFNDLNGNGLRDASEPGLDKWAVTSNVLVNNKNQDSQGKTYDRTVLTNAKGEYALGACNPKKDASGKYDSAEVAKCLTLPGWFAVAVEQRAGWTSTTPNPFDKFDLNVFVSAQNTVNYDSYAGLEFGLFNGYILKTTAPANGTIISADSKINCSVTSSKTCQAGFPVNSSVTLTAKPATGYFFNQWSGNCSGTSPSITLKMDASKSCSATFIQAIPLNVSINSGDSKMNMNTITSQPTGISCSVGGVMTPDCKEDYILNQVITLKATPSTGYIFTSWSGACTGNASTTTVKMDFAKTCVANFSPSFGLSVSKTGNGTITGTGINCGTDCSEPFAANTKVTLTATPATGYLLGQWGGSCSGTNITTTITMDAVKSCTASFLPSLNLTVSKTGNGTITGTGINCGTDCAEPFVANTKVTLTAMPNSDSYFSNWTGACAGSALTCTVTMNAAQTVSAVFKPFVKKELTSSTLDFSILSGIFKGRKCETQETEICLPKGCQFLGNQENRFSINNQGNGAGATLSSYVNSKEETCSKLKVEVCAHANSSVHAWYTGSTTISGLCK